MQWFKVPSKIYFERNSIQYLQTCEDIERVMIVTDKSIEKLGFVQRVIDQLNARSNRVTIQVFSDVEPDPDITTVERGAEVMKHSNQTQSLLWWWFSNGRGQSNVALLRTTRN